MVNIGIIGYGYWGPNMVRNFSASKLGTVNVVADQRVDRLAVIKANYPSITTTESADDLIANKDVDAIVIATPVFTHYELAKKALSAGKHVLVEKPMTSSSAEAQELIELAESKGLVLMVDHTFLYTGAVQKIKEIVNSGGIGKMKYFDSTRINLGLFQPDINVLWDLAPHDISILTHIIDEAPYSIQATGVCHTGNDIENIAYMTVNFQSNIIAHFNCSWSSPVKIRQTLIGGDKKMIVYNDNEPTEKIKIYDTNYNHQTDNSDEGRRRVLVDYRTGDINIPKVPMREALAGVAEDFIGAIENGTTPVSTCHSGLAVVKVLEAAQKSIKNGGKEVIL